MIKIFKNCSKKFTYILKRMRFSLYICHYAKFCFFFQFGPQALFLDDQVLI
jgi:hypothetical protein